MNIISKIQSIYKNEGFVSLCKRSAIFVKNKVRINTIKRISYVKNKRRLEFQLDEIFSRDFERIVVWRGTFGWNTKLFQRHQQIAIGLGNMKVLVLFEVTRHTEKVNFIEKIDSNVYLVDYELKDFSEMFNAKLQLSDKPKYLQIYSTAWDLNFTMVEDYISNGFSLLYEYVDDLNPVLAGLDSIPEEVNKIYNYVIENREVLVVTSAKKLYSEMVKRRKSNHNIILSSNGVDVEHFKNCEFITISELEKIKREFTTIVGYYGAIANWFDYSVLKELAKRNEKVAFVLIGVKYDDSFDKAELGDYKNIFYFDAVSYDMLPSFANYFDIAWIPFIINEITLATNPVKAFEYMALGKYIITSDMPECRRYKSINIARSVDEYQHLIDNYKTLYTDEYKKLLFKEAKENSWSKKASEIVELMKENEKNAKD